MPHAISGDSLEWPVPAVAPELLQPLSPHSQKETLRPGEQGWPGRCRGAGGAGPLAPRLASCTRHYEGSRHTSSE